MIYNILLKNMLEKNCIFFIKKFQNKNSNEQMSKIVFF